MLITSGIWWTPGPEPGLQSLLSSAAGEQTYALRDSSSLKPLVSPLTSCTIQATHYCLLKPCTEPSDSSDGAVLFPVSLHTSQGTKLGRSFVSLAALGSSKYARCFSPASSQEGKKPCHTKQSMKSTTLLKQVECLTDHLSSQPVIHLADSIIRAWWLKKKFCLMQGKCIIF